MNEMCKGCPFSGEVCQSFPCPYRTQFGPPKTSEHLGENLVCTHCGWSGSREAAVITKLGDQPLLGGFGFHCPGCGRYIRALDYDDFMEAAYGQECSEPGE